MTEQIDPPVRLLVTFQQAYPELSPEHIVQAPGRSIWVAAACGHTDQFIIHVPDIGAKAVFSWRTAKFKRTILNRPLPKWSRYPAGVIYALCAAGLDVSGMNAVIVGDEAFGPRYEHGMGMALAALLHTLHDKAYTAESLLEIVEKVRRDYVDT